VVSRIPHAAATIVPFDVRSRLESISDRQARASAERGPGAETGAPGPETGQRSAETAPPGPASPPGSPDRPEPTGQPGPADGTASPAEAEPAGQPGPASQPGAAGRAGQDVPDEPVPASQDEAAAEAAAVTDLSGIGVPAADAYDRPVPSAGVNPISSLTGPGRATVEGRIFAVEIRPVERNTVLAAEIADSTGQLTALFYGRSHIPGLDCGARIRFRGPVGIQDGAPVMINPAYELLAQGSPNPPGPAEREGGKTRRDRRNPDSKT
jgi:hypothetical protein